MENQIVVSQHYTMAAYLVANPDIIVSVWNGNKLSYFKYDINDGKFYYCVPENKVRNKWYEARGLKGHFDSGMHTLLNKDSINHKKNSKVEDLPY